MLNLAEYRKKPRRLADFLPWAALIAPGIVLNKDGSFQRTARFRGPDLESATPAELVGTTARLNNAMRRLGSGWAIFIKASRVPAQNHPRSQFPDAVSALVDYERREQFQEEGAHFESFYYLTFVWMPPAEDASRAEGWLYEGKSREGVDGKELLNGFADRTGRILQLIEGFVPEAVWLDDEETLTYLHACVSTKRHRVRLPETPIYLDTLLADQPFTGGLEPRLGAHYLRTLTIIGFPASTFPGILDELNRLAFPYRWSTRAIMLDKTDATRLLTKIRRQWFAKRNSIAAILKEVMTNEASTLLDTDAANKAADADMALRELGSDEIGQAYVTATVTVWDEDSGAAAEKLRLVEKVIEGRDFTCIHETVNVIEAWLGSLPGHVYANVRQPPVSILNLAHMMPLSAVWAGPERDDHFAAPPLFFARTEGATPFRFSLHVGDVGHTLIIEPTGAGKSVLLALMALQFRRYFGAQIFAFDFGGSMRAAALAMGGERHDLGGALSQDAEEPVALQPLARIDEYVEEAWAAEWIEALLAREGVTITPEAKEHIWSAVTSLASAPASERTLTGLSVLLESNALKQALQPYCLGGPYGRLLDAESERLGAADVQVFETEGLIGRGAVPAVLAYLFHRIEGRLDGRPTLLIIDEGWLALDDNNFAQQLREWLKTLRKKNASVIFATQSLADIETSAIAPALIESCPTRIFLPNERAIEPRITSIYRRFGLNDRQIEIISRATPKRDYYCQSRRGNRLFELGLGDVALALTATSSKTDQAAIAVALATSSPQHESRGLVMSRKNHVTAVAPVLAIILAMAVVEPVRAQLLVFDPSNYSQNLLTAARSLQQIQNQITSLQNQARMLINQAKQLEQLPATVLNDVERDYSQIQNLLRQADGITYNVHSMNQAFSQRYPVSISTATSDQQMIGSARQRWQDSLSAFQHSLTLGAGAVQNLPNTQAQTGSLLASSQSSVGILQATQAGNQLVAVQTRQLADLTALLAAQGRAQALEAARKAEAEGQAQEQLRRFLSNGRGYQPQTVQMFH